VVIPVINEGGRITRQLEKMRRVGYLADIIIADGGSADGSTEKGRLRRLGVRTLLVKTGPGRLGAQLRMGYHYALVLQGYSGVVTVDGNGKDGVGAVPRFLEKLGEGYGLVQGSRFARGGAEENTPLSRLLAMRLVYTPLVSLLAGFGYTDATNGFRAYSKKFLLDARVGAFRKIFSTYELLPYLSVKAPRLGYKVCEIPVSRVYPKDGETPTKYGPVSGNLRFLKILLGLVLGKYDQR
jgi:dolichol-phosphate mannosyltransferase